MIKVIEIILTFLKVGALCFGGGYASIAVVEKEIVNIKKWLSIREFTDLIAIDEITPGPIIVNVSTFIGTKVMGLLGAISATLSAILIPCLISLLLIIVYRKYKDLKILNDILGILKSMAFALILSTLITIFINATFKEGIILFENINYFLIILMIISFIAIRKYKVYPIVVMLICGVLNLFINII